MKTMRNLSFLLLIVVVALTSPARLNASQYRYCDEGESGGLYVYYGNGPFYAQDGWTMQDMIDYCNNMDEWCTYFSICETTCDTQYVSESDCEPWSQCSGCGGGGDNVFGYDAYCRCYWDSPTR